MATDARGHTFHVGDKVAKADKLFQTDGLFVRECTVTKVDGAKIYIDDSTRPLVHPERVMILFTKG
jgi:hypothetical protein